MSGRWRDLQDVETTTAEQGLAIVIRHGRSGRLRTAALSARYEVPDDADLTASAPVVVAKTPSTVATNAGLSDRR